MTPSILFLFSFLVTVLGAAGRPSISKVLVADAVQRNAVCADGTPGAYYIDQPEVESGKLVIFFRGGGFCVDSDTCDDRDEWSTTSADDWVPNTTEFHSFLSSSSAENPLFYDATRLFLHYCSNDMWLGNNTFHGLEFRGHAIFQSVIEDTLLQSAESITEVLISGVSAGGIGALYHSQQIQSMFPNAKTYLITDSNSFTPALELLTDLYPTTNQSLTPFDHINQAYAPTNPSCQTQVQSSGTSTIFNCCVFADCMLRQRFVAETVPILLVQPMLDLLLFSAGLVRYENQQEGSVSFSSEPPLARVFELGSRLISHMNISNPSNYVEETVSDFFVSRISIFQPSCTLHGLVRPITPVDAEMHSDVEVVVDSFHVSLSLHNSVPQWYGTLSVNGVTLRDAVEEFVTRQRTNNPNPVVHVDTCRGWSCNPTCPEQLDVNIGATDVPGVDLPLATGAMIVAGLTSCLVVTGLWHRLRAKSLSKGKVDLAIEIRMLEASSVKGKNTPVQVRNLSYDIQVGSDSHRLLDSVSVTLEPGKVTAVMGPSGAGKTTFLDVVSGRRTVGTAYGSIHFANVCMLGNGESQKWLLDRSGYVKQNVTPACPSLTVRENLLFAADLRLSADLTIDKKRERVDAVIRMLKMERFENVLVGTGQGLGLSGGQRKKLAVAIQLLKNPGILFLDEPTSGLDSTSSLEISMLLRRLARSNRTIVLTIHQPRVEIWEMLDSVLLLCGGKVAYHGAPDKANSFFLTALKGANSDVAKQVVDRLNDGASFEDNPAHLLIDVLRFPEVKHALLAWHHELCMLPPLLQSKLPIVDRKTIKSELVGLLALVMRNLLWGKSLMKISIQILIYTLAVAWICRSVSEPLVVASSYFLVSLPHFFAISGSYFVMIRTRFPLFWEEVADGAVTPMQFFTALAAELAGTAAFASLAATPVAYYMLTPAEWLDGLTMLRMTVGWGLTSFSLSMMCLSVYILTQSQPVLTSFIALASAFSGVIVPAHSLPVELRWFVEVNPLYLGNVAVLNIGMRGQSHGDCEFDSDTFCIADSASFALAQLGMLDKDPVWMVWRILIIAFAIVALGFVGFYLASKEQLRRLELLDPNLSTRITDDQMMSPRSLDGEQEKSLRAAVLSRRHNPGALPKVILTDNSAITIGNNNNPPMASPAVFFAKLGGSFRNRNSPSPQAPRFDEGLPKRRSGSLLPSNSPQDFVKKHLSPQSRSPFVPRETNTPKKRSPTFSEVSPRVRSTRIRKNSFSHMREIRLE